MKKRKKKFSVKKLLLFIIFMSLIGFSIYYILNIRVKNIIVLNNYYYNDNIIIEKSNLDNYPKLYKVNISKIKKDLLELDLIENVYIKRTFKGEITIDIKEKKILYYDRSDEEYITSDSKRYKLDKIYGIPTLINYVPDDIEFEFIKEFKNIDNNIIQSISEIEYSKTDYDDSRFLLTMNDGNQVYITTSKLNLLNKYIDIVKELNNKKGILYLDSGNYFEVKSK